LCIKIKITSKREHEQTQPKEKTKANNQRKIWKRKSYANKTRGYKMTINNNKKDLRQESNHLPQIGY
jgi:hypothetical protein